MQSGQLELPLDGVFSAPYIPGSATSKAAAESLTSAKHDRGRLLEYFKQCGELGATDFQCQQALGMSGDTQRPRRGELERAGLIRKNGLTRKAKKSQAEVRVAV